MESFFFHPEIGKNMLTCFEICQIAKYIFTIFEMEFFFMLLYMLECTMEWSRLGKVWVRQLGQARQHAPNFIMGMGRPLCDINI